MEIINPRVTRLMEPFFADLQREINSLSSDIAVRDLQQVTKWVVMLLNSSFLLVENIFDCVSKSCVTSSRIWFIVSFWSVKSLEKTHRLRFLLRDLVRCNRHGKADKPVSCVNWVSYLMYRESEIKFPTYFNINTFEERQCKCLDWTCLSYFVFKKNVRTFLL